MTEVTSKVKGWLAIIETIGAMTTEESSFGFTEEGIVFKSMDPSHHEAVNFLWKKENMTSYELTSVNEIVGFRVDDFKSILKRFDKAGDVQVIKDTGAGVLQLHQGQKTFEMILVHADHLEEVPDKVKAELEYKFELEFDVLKDVVGDMKIAGDYIRLEVKNGGLLFTGGNDSENHKAKRDSGIRIAAEDGSTMISIEYVADFISTISQYATKGSFEFGNDKPLQGLFDIEGIGSVRFFIAPKIK